MRGEPHDSSKIEQGPGHRGCETLQVGPILWSTTHPVGEEIGKGEVEDVRELEQLQSERDLRGWMVTVKATMVAQQRGGISRLQRYDRLEDQALAHTEVRRLAGRRATSVGS